MRKSCYVRPCAIKLRDTTDQFIWESPKTGLPCNPTHFRDVFRKSLEEAGDVRLLTPHSCRHTYVSQMQALGVDIGFWRRIAAPVTVGIRQGLLWFQPCRSGASNRSFPHRLAPPGGSLQAENTSFFPRQRICACFKVSLFYQTGLPLSSSLVQMRNEENSTFDGKFRAGFILRCTGTGQRPAEVCASPVSSIIMTLP